MCPLKHANQKLQAVAELRFLVSCPDIAVDKRSAVVQLILCSVIGTSCDDCPADSVHPNSPCAAGQAGETLVRSSMLPTGPLIRNNCVNLCQHRVTATCPWGQHPLLIHKGQQQVKNAVPHASGHT
jgi:hypothetical protein